MIYENCPEAEGCSIKWEIVGGLPAGESRIYRLETLNIDNYQGNVSHVNTAAVYRGEVEFGSDEAVVRIRVPQIVLKGYVWHDNGAGVPSQAGDGLWMMVNRVCPE